MLKNCAINLSKKVVIATVPFVDENTPLAAPAVLKAALASSGIDCIGLDLNIEIYNKLQNHPNRQLFLDFFYKQEINDVIVDELVSMLQFYTQEILSHGPTIVGLSLFCFNCQVFTAWLCAMLRQQAPTIKIIIGGPGLQTLENSLFKFPERLQQLGFVDDYITGDADASLVEYVKGNQTYPGINSTSWEIIKNFDQLPVPDFSDYRFFKYGYALIPIVDSRGCVQNCEFCDVISFWKKFQYLSADSIFKRIEMYINQYGIYRFQFSSSICNGNLREFKKLIKLIAHHNQQSKTEEQIYWVGSFIVRTATQHPEEMWKLIKTSNGFLLTGVESVIERVRIGLGKRFTNQDLDYHLVMLKKYQIPTNLLLIAAYPTETIEEYQQSKQWFIDRKEFANNTIQQVQITSPTVLPGTRLEKNIDLENFNNTVLTRKTQAIELATLVQQCGFNVNHFR